MFNRSYQIRAVKAAGGGNRVAQAVLAATEGGAFYRPGRRVAPGAAREKLAGIACKKRSSPLQLALEFPLSEEQLAEEFERTFG
jgi:hypothetical protein